MVYKQWIVNTNGKDKYHVGFDFDKDVIDKVLNFDIIINELADNFKFNYKEGKVYYISEDLNDALSMALKVFEIYLSVTNHVQ